MIVLYIFLYILAAAAGLLLLLALLLSVSAGVRVKNLRGETVVTLRYGIFRYRLSPGRPVSEKKKAKKEAKARRNAEKKALKKLRKEEKERAKALKQQRKPGTKKKKPGGKKPKPPETESKPAIIRALAAAVFDYDYPYLKLIYLKKLELHIAVGGESPAAVGQNYAKACAAFGAFFPQIQKNLKIKRHRIFIAPDFVRKKGGFKFDLILLTRPIRAVRAAAVFYLAYRRNLRIYGRGSGQGTEIKSGKRKGPARKRPGTQGKRPREGAGIKTGGIKNGGQKQNK